MICSIHEVYVKQPMGLIIHLKLMVASIQVHSKRTTFLYPQALYFWQTFILFCTLLLAMDFPGGSEGKASAYNARDLGSIPGSGRSPGEGNGNPLQYSCLENPMDGEAWEATVHGVTKSWTWLRDFTFTFLTSYFRYRLF